MEEIENDAKTILIVDDEQPIVDILVYNLQKEGYKTIEAGDGLTAVELATEKRPDLILLDIMLPGKNGFEILQSIKQEKLKTPIIMLTAKSQMNDKLQGLENGADDYITKPFHTRELLARIKNILKRTNDVDSINKLEFGDLTLNLDTC